MRLIALLVASSLLFLSGCDDRKQPANSASSGASFEVTSSAFAPGSAIPAKYTCEGHDTSPPLAWKGAPEGTRSFALVVSDPDAPDPKAPKMTWIHWVLYDIPVATSALAEGVSAPPAGARAGTNDWNKSGYGGPCPPVGRHRYVHTVYALDALLGDLGEVTKAELEKAMQGHILGQGQLIGTYQQSKP